MPQAVCDFCNRNFASDATLQQHIVTTHAPSPYCDTCVEWFSTHSDLEDHIATSTAHQLPPSLACISCSLTFDSKAELAEHEQNSLLHKYAVGQFYCDDCVLWFCDQEELDRHLRDSEQHATYFACVECGREFEGRRELEAHLLMQAFCMSGITADNYDYDDQGSDNGVKLNEDLIDEAPVVTSGGGATRFEVGNVNVHRDRDRGGLLGGSLGWPSGFDLANSSRLHGQTPSVYHCLGETCFRTFGRPSALLQHLDSGACPSGITRHLVNAVSISTDHTSLFTNQLLRASAGRNIQEVHDNPEDAVARALKAYNRLDQPTARPQSPTEFEQHQETQNQQIFGLSGSFYQCPLCDKDFRSSLSLHAHMNSQVHDSKIYHCPRTTLADHDPSGSTLHETRNFSTLGSLAQHLESSGCTDQKDFSVRFRDTRRFNATVIEVQKTLKKMSLHLEGPSKAWGNLEDGSMTEDYF